MDYSEVALGIWNSGYQGDQLNKSILADLLWDEGARETEIIPALKNLGFSLPEIFVSLQGVTKQDGTGLSNKDISLGIWTSEYEKAEVDPGIIADLLWDSGVSEVEIGQTLKDAGFDLREIANALDDGVTKSDGTGLNYSEVAIGLWNSGYQGTQLYPRVLADLLWDEGANEIEVSQSLKEIGFNLPTIAPVDGSALIDLLANLNPNISVSDKDFITEVAQTLYYQLGFTVGGIVENVLNSQLNKNVDNPTGNRFLLTSLFLRNSGLALNPKEVADVFWDLGANPKDIAQILYNVFDRNLTEVAYDMETGITNSDGSGLNLASIALGLSGAEFSVNGNSPVSGSQIVYALLEIGASVREIGKALIGIGYTLPEISSAILDTFFVDAELNIEALNYANVADALWWRGSGIDDARELADFLWDQGATQQQIGQALNYIGLSPGVIADALNDGVILNNGQTFNYIDTALGLWNSGIQFKSGAELAGLLWNERANSTEIAEALRLTNSTVFSLEVIADSLNEGTGFGYTDIAKGLWNSGYSFKSRKLADLLWDEGANQRQIGAALRGVGLELATIADAVKNGVTKSDGTKLNYSDSAIALWNSGYATNLSEITGILWDSGATQQQIGIALRNIDLDDTTRSFNLQTILDSVYKGVSKFGYGDAAIALWNSGYALDSRKLADTLWSIGADPAEIGQALKLVGFDLATIADAMDDGATGFKYTDVALAVWNSGYGRNPEKLATILRREGAGFGETVNIVDNVTGSNFSDSGNVVVDFFGSVIEKGDAVLDVLKGDFKDFVNAAKKQFNNSVGQAELLKSNLTILLVKQRNFTKRTKEF